MPRGKAAAPPAATEQMIPLSSIHTGDLSMRTALHQGKLADLAQSLSSCGLINAVVVIRHEGTFELVAGHRRCAAAEMLGWKEIRAQIREADDFQAAEIAWAENAARDEVSVVDQARWIAAAMARYGLNQTTMAQQLQLSPSHLSGILATLRYPDTLREALEAGAVNHGVARALSQIDDEPTLDYYLQQAAEFGCTARTAEEWVRNWKVSKLTSETLQSQAGDTPPLGTHATIYAKTCPVCRSPITGPSVHFEACTGCAHVIVSESAPPAPLPNNGAYHPSHG